MTVDTIPLDSDAIDQALLISALYTEMIRQGMPATQPNLERVVKRLCSPWFLFTQQLRYLTRNRRQQYFRY